MNVYIIIFLFVSKVPDIIHRVRDNSIINLDEDQNIFLITSVIPSL